MLFDKIGSQCRYRYSSEGRSHLLDLLFHFFWILSPTLSASFLDVSQEFPRLSVFLTIILKSFSIYKLHSSFNLSFPLSQSCLPSFLLGVTQCVPFHFGEKNKGLNISRLQRIWGRRKKVWCSKEFLRVGEDLCSCFPWLTIIFSLYSQSQNKLQQARFWISSVYHKADKGILSVMFLLTHCSQGLGHFLHSTLSNVVLISCEHTHTHTKSQFRVIFVYLLLFFLSFFFSQLPCLNSFARTHRILWTFKVQKAHQQQECWSSAFKKAVFSHFPEETELIYLLRPYPASQIPMCTAANKGFTVLLVWSLFKPLLSWHFNAWCTSKLSVPLRTPLNTSFLILYALITLFFLVQMTSPVHFKTTTKLVC